MPNLTSNYYVKHNTTAYNAGYVLADLVVAGKMPLIKWILHQWSNADLKPAAHAAVKHNRLDILIFLCQKGLDTNFDENFNENLLLKQAAEFGREDIMTYLLASTKKDITNEALILAAKYGFLKIIQLLRSGLVDPSLINLLIQTAVSYGHLNIMEYLQLLGGFLSVSDATVLNTAASRGDLSTVKFLYRCGFDVWNNDCACAAIRNGHLHVLQYLHAKGNNIFNYQYRCLVLAAEMGYLPIAKYLVGHGADVRAQTDAAITLAAMNGHFDMVQFLHSKGADLSACLHVVIREYPNLSMNDTNPITILKFFYTACDKTVAFHDGTFTTGQLTSDYAAIIEFMQAKGLDFCNVNDYHLITAAKYGCLDTVEMLYRSGANVAAQGNKAIRTAARRDRFSVLQFLYQHGADITAITSCGAKVESYVKAKKWLHNPNEVSKIKRLAAQSYVRHHSMLPDAAMIPTEVTEILSVVQL